jgi:hypothetical protein
MYAMFIMQVSVVTVNPLWLAEFLVEIDFTPV